MWDYWDINGIATKTKIIMTGTEIMAVIEAGLISPRIIVIVQEVLIDSLHSNSMVWYGIYTPMAMSDSPYSHSHTSCHNLLG